MTKKELNFDSSEILHYTDRYQIFKLDLLLFALVGTVAVEVDDQQN